MQLKIILVIGLGSFLGGILRYLLSHTVTTRVVSSFPFGTLLVNILGCLAIGILYGLFEKNNPGQEWRLFMTTGLLGGFTTFSAFSMESVVLIKTGNPGLAGLYIIASVVLGLAATFLGVWMSKIF